MGSSDAAGRWTRRALWLALAGLALAVSLQQIRSADYWWHLRTGQLIAETGAVPRADPYTYTFPGARWIDVYWLFQLGLYGVHHLGGHKGVVLAKAVTALGLVAVLAPIGYRRERAALSVAALATLLVLLGDRLMPRPELPTFLLLAGVLALLERFRRTGDAAVYAIPVLQLVWVNMHGLFALGLALCGFYLLAEVAEWLGAASERAERWVRVRRLGVATLLAALASFANPNGVAGVLYPLATLGAIGPAETRGLLGSIITELAPTLSEGGLPPASRGLFVALAAASLGATALNWRRIALSDVFVLLSFLYLALGARRNAPLFAIVAAPLLVRNLNAFLDARSRPLRVPALVGAAVALAVAVLAFDAARGRLFSHVATLREPGLGVMEVFHPVAAVDWIERVRPPGPIAHALIDGGYLIWRLHPDYPVMIDGRAPEVFGLRGLLELQIASVERFRALDAEHRFGVVLLNNTFPGTEVLLDWLRLNSNWRLAFVDDTAAVFVRETGAPGPGPPEVDIDASDLFGPLDPEPSEIEMLRLVSRTRFYISFRRYARALATWEATMERYPDVPQRIVTHANLLERNGLGASAEAVLNQALAERPDDPALHTQLGDLRLEDGDDDGARAHYDAALTWDPGFPRALIGLAWLAERAGDPGTALLLYQRVLAQGPRAGPLAATAASRMQVLAEAQPGF